MFQSHLLGRLFGVEVRLHGTVLLLAAVLGLTSMASGGVAAAVATVVLLATVLGCVTLHELGHIAMARAFGTYTTGITLYPFGGVASLTRPAASAKEEVLVALAGPAVNLALAAIAAVPMVLLGPIEPLATLFLVNAALLVFNLFPAYPMDGGRVLRGILWLFTGERRATYWAARVGQVLSVAMGIGGLVGGLPMLALVALVVFMQATGEVRRLRAGGGGSLHDGVDAVDPALFQRIQRAAERPFAWARGAPDPFRPFQQPRVVVHTGSGVWEQWTLPDGRVVRRQVGD